MRGTKRKSLAGENEAFQRKGTHSVKSALREGVRMSSPVNSVQSNPSTVLS